MLTLIIRGIFKMGAILISKTLPDNIKTAAQVKKYFKALKIKTLNKHKKNKKYWEYIMSTSNGESTDYTGDWGTFAGYGVLVLNQICTSRINAKNLLELNSEKWGEVVAIKFKKNGATRWLIGGLAAI